MEQQKFLEEISVWQHPPQSGIAQTEEENKKFFMENQTDSLLQPHIKLTQHWMMRKQKMISGLLREIPFVAIMWNSESNRSCREKNHFLFRWNKSTLPEILIQHGMSCWWKYGWSLERGWRSWIVRYVDGNHKIYKNERETTRWVYVVRGRDRQENKRPPGLTNYGQTCGNTCPMHQKREEKQKWATERLKLDNGRRLRGIYFIDPDNEEFKRIMKNARRKLEVPMPVAMPCKTPMCQSSRKTCRNIGKTQDKIRLYFRSWRIYENPNGRSSSQIIMKITLQEKAWIHWIPTI